MHKATYTTMKDYNTGQFTCSVSCTCGAGMKTKAFEKRSQAKNQAERLFANHVSRFK